MTCPLAERQVVRDKNIPSSCRECISGAKNMRLLSTAVLCEEELQELHGLTFADLEQGAGVQSVSLTRAPIKEGRLARFIFEDTFNPDAPDSSGEVDVVFYVVDCRNEV